MGIFNTLDEERIRTIHENRAQEDKKLFFEYFSDLAVRDILDMILEKKESYLMLIEENARRYSTRHTRQIPILQFKSVKQLNMKGKNYRKNAQEFYSTYEPTGSYYKSLTGIHVVDLSSIYRNSDFRQRVNESLGSDMFYISLTSKILTEHSNVRHYENTLWLNVRI